MFEELYPEIVAYDSRGNNLGSIPDFRKSLHEFSERRRFG